LSTDIINLTCRRKAMIFHTEVVRMGIEPLGSMMTIQAQPVVAPKVEVQTEKPADEYNANVQPANQIDKTTNVVENSKEKEKK